MQQIKPAQMVGLMKDGTIIGFDGRAEYDNLTNSPEFKDKWSILMANAGDIKTELNQFHRLTMFLQHLDPIDFDDAEEMYDKIQENLPI
jgi:hypothetical protein